MNDASDRQFPDDDPKLGDLLRQAREERGLDLSELAGLTHVRREYLAALEEGRYGDLPEDVYTKNFLRLYAQAVGFDVVRAQELYRSERRELGGFNTMEQRLERDNEIAADVEPLGDGGRWWDSPRQGSRRWGGLLSTIVMVAAVVALALWGFNSTFFNPSRTAPNEEESTAATAGNESRETPAVSGSEGTEAENVVPRTVRLSVASEPPGAEVSVDGFPLPGTTPIESAPVTARPSRTIRVTLEGYQPAEAQFDLTFDRNISFALSPVPDEPAAAGATGGEADPEAAPTETAQQEGAGADEPTATLTITEDTWLEVYQGTARNEGQRLAFTTARAGQTLSFPLPIYVHMGNAGGVELTVDGQERGPLGSTGEVRGLAITGQ